MENQAPAILISEAVKNGADLDKLRGLLDLQERWDANQAKKAYAMSFASAQAEIEGVVKAKFNPQTKSKYADLSGVIESASPVYTKHGFAVTFNEGDSPKEGHVRILADVLHQHGHKETYHYDVPLDGVGIKGNANMTAIHGKASSTTYGRRYLMCMIWNIPTEDTDGNVKSEKITDEQKSTICDLLSADDLDVKKFLAFMQVDEIANINAVDFDKAVQAIKTTAEKKRGKK